MLYSASSPNGKSYLGPQHPAQPNSQRSARSRLSSLGRVGHDMPSQPAKPAHGPARKPGAGPAASRRRMGSNGHPPISARQNRRPVHPPQTLAHFSPSLSSPEPGPAAALAGASQQAGPLAMVARKGPAPSFLFPSTPFLSAASFGAVMADTAHRWRRQRRCRPPRRRARPLVCGRAAVERPCIGAQARMEQRLGSSSRTRRRWHAGEPTPWLFFPRSHGRRWSSSRCVPSALSLLGLVIAFSFQLRFEIELHLVLSLFLSIRKRILSKSIYSIDRL